MIRLIQRRLIIPRGDTGTFSIPVLTSSNMGDVSIFTIFNPLTHKKIAEKRMEISDGVLTVTFSHGDTVNLPAGQYVWDIKFYKNPVFAGEQLIDGEEIDSYYAAFSLPVCEIRETGDSLLMDDDTPQAKLAPDQIDLISAAITATQTAKEAAVNSAADAETSASAAATSAQAALESKDAALASQTSAATSESNAAESAAAAQASATQAVQIAQQIHEEIPTKVSDLVDDSGHYTKPVTGIPASDLEETYLTSFTEEDPTVPEWAKQPQKPTYTAQEVGALPDDTYIPSKTSDLVNDSDYAVDANYIHTDNNYTTAEKNKLEGIAAGAEVNVNADWNAVDGDAFILNKPTKVSDFTNDVGYLTEHQDISGKANSADLAAVATSGSYEDLSDKPTIPEVPVQDVQVAGTSIVNDSVANVPIASNNTPGLFYSNTTSGFSFNTVDGVPMVQIKGATPTQMQAGMESRRAIVPAFQHYSIFYGLAKAAGDTTQSQSDNTVGTYTDSAKTAIQQMLDVPSTAAIPTNVSQLQNDSGYLTSFTETDPTVPKWAKAATKPSYTAAEVGAPTVAEMNTAIGNAIGNINSFDMAVVQELPTQDISTHTIYLVPKTGETNDVYDEYVYINDAWEMVGNTQVDLSNYVQKTDYASNSNYGVVQTDPNFGINSVNGVLSIGYASTSDIKAATNYYKPIGPRRVKHAAFYGLAQAAGDTTQSQSDNAVGTYTDEAKAAIQQMLDVPSTSDIPDTSIYATKVDTVLETTLSRGRKEGTTIGAGSFAFGNQVEASGANSFAIGNHTIASNSYAYAEGGYNQAVGMFSHAEGGHIALNGANIAKGLASHAEGSMTIASGQNSHTEGTGTRAVGHSSHTEGKFNVEDSYFTWNEWVANTEYSIGDKVKLTTTDNEIITVKGYICKIANSDTDFTIANWNQDSKMNYAEIIGNGTTDDARSNAYALDWDGNGHYMGSIYVGANADSTGGTKVLCEADFATAQDIQNIINGGAGA